MGSAVDSVGVPSVVVYNAAALVPRMSGGSLLMTAGMPDPLPQLTSLSLGKAGLRTLAALLGRAYPAIHRSRLRRAYRAL